MPGDSRLLSARDCFVNQAMLTGEAFPVKKHAGDLAAPADEASGAVEFSVHGNVRHQRHRARVGVPDGAATELGGLAEGLAAAAAD